MFSTILVHFYRKLLDGIERRNTSGLKGESKGL